MRRWWLPGVVALVAGGCGAAPAPYDPDEDLLQVRPTAPSGGTADRPSARTAIGSTDTGHVPVATYRCPTAGPDATWTQPVTSVARCPHCDGDCLPHLVRVEERPATEVAGPDRSR